MTVKIGNVTWHLIRIIKNFEIGELNNIKFTIDTVEHTAYKLKPLTAHLTLMTGIFFKHDKYQINETT